MARTRIALIGSDLDAMTRIYLGLKQRNYRVETTEVPVDRTWLRKFRPDVLILEQSGYEAIGAEQKMPVIVYLDADAAAFQHPEGVFLLRKPVQLDELLALLDRIVY